MKQPTLYQLILPESGIIYSARDWFCNSSNDDFWTSAVNLLVW